MPTFAALGSVSGSWDCLFEAAVVVAGGVHTRIMLLNLTGRYSALKFLRRAWLIVQKTEIIIVGYQFVDLVFR